MCASVSFIIFLICVFLRVVTSQTGTDAKNLRIQLFDTNGYDKKVRSASNVTDPTEVWVEFYLMSINSLDEATETLKTTGYLSMNWYDSYLVWNASDYGGLTYTFFPQDDVWKPDVALQNSVKEYKELGVASLNVIAYYDGNIVWSPFQMFESSCAVDITYYPFDTQTCQLVFVAWSYSKQEVDMMEGTNGIDLVDYVSNSEWEIIGSDAHVKQDTFEASVIFTLKLKRKPRYIILNNILPCVMLSILNILVFVLPCDSGEKASYAVTVFLSFAVFLTIVSSTLPENSDTVSLFSVYLISLNVQSTLITVVALVLIRINTFGPSTKIPKPIILLMDCLTCKPCLNKETRIEPSEVHITNMDEGFETKQVKTKPVSPAPVKENYDWKQVANMLDLLFFLFFSLSSFLTTVVCLTVAANS